ncbi:MAG: anthranilate synthase component I, partial [Acetanaerobacterium sp.]
MITPDARTIERLAKTYNTIPVCKEIYADIATPITLLRRLAQKSERYFLLESVEGGERWSRYSFLGFDPVLRATCKDGVVTIEGDGGTQVKTDKPLEVLRDILERYHAPRIEGLPPFTGGFVGYFGYSMMGYAEPTLSLSTDELPDYDLLLFDKVIAYDHLKQKICVVVNMPTENVMESYGRAVSEIEGIVRTILDTSPLPPTRADSKTA